MTTQIKKSCDISDIMLLTNSIVANGKYWASTTYLQQLNQSLALMCGNATDTEKYISQIFYIIREINVNVVLSNVMRNLIDEFVQCVLQLYNSGINQPFMYENSFVGNTITVDGHTISYCRIPKTGSVLHIEKIQNDSVQYDRLYYQTTIEPSTNLQTVCVSFNKDFFDKDFSIITFLHSTIEVTHLV